MTIIFDWDGTLHETKYLYGKAFRENYKRLVEAGLAEDKVYTDDETACYLGLNAIDMWNQFMPELPEEEKKKSSQMIGEEMVRLVRSGEATLYPGALELLEELKERGHELVFLSNCKHAYMQAHRDYFDLDKFFSAFYCCEDYGFIPKEEIFLDIVKKHPGPYLIIGDRESDFKVAETHDLPSIGCRYGYGTEEELKHSKVQIDSCIEALDFV